MTARMVDYARAAFDLIDHFDGAKTTDQVMSQLGSALSAFGYNAFLITGVPEPPLRVEAYFLLNGWPDGFGTEYHQKNYYRDDPIAAWCRRSIDPYEWSEAKYNPETWPRAATVMQLADDFGMKRGFCVPIIRANGFTACVTMAGDKPDFDPEAKKAMHLISLYAHAKAVKLMRMDAALRTDGRMLTKREAEALTWIAAGKSSWEVASIMGITERTVNKFVADAAQKLKARTRTQAVVNAIFAREIQIPG